MTLGEKVRSLRESQELSRQQLADITGISYSYIAKIETGEREEVSLENIEKLSVALKVDPRFFREDRARLPKDLFVDIPEELQKAVIDKSFHPCLLATIEAVEKGVTLQQLKAALRILTEVVNK